MLRFTPIILALIYGYLMYRFSAWNTARMLDQNSTPLRDGRLDPLIDRLADQLDLPNLQVFVFENPMVNGLAAPDGRIFLTRGFLDKLDMGQVSADELASVIAHELGHVALGHSRRRMIDFSGHMALRTAMIMILARFIPFIGFIGPMIAGLISNLLSARLSRKDEFEADKYATALLLRSGIGTDGQKSLFHKLEALTGSRATSAPWLLSHPPTADRIRAIEENETRWRA